MFWFSFSFNFLVRVSLLACLSVLTKRGVLCKSNKRGATGVGWAWGSKREKAIVSRLRRTGRTNAWSGADGTHLAFFDEEEISTPETSPMDGMNRPKSRNDCIIEKEFLGGLTAYLGCGLLGL